MDSREIIKELIENEMRRLEEVDYDGPIAYNGIDRYDSDEEKKERYLGLEKYQKLTSIKEKLEIDKKHSRPSILPKKETAFLDER